MTNKNLYKALDALDPESILSAAPGEGKCRARPALQWRKWGTMAACLLLCVTLVFATAVLPGLLRGTPHDTPTPEEPYVPPAFENAVLSANSVASIFNSSGGYEAGVATTSYHKVFLPEGVSPDLGTIPTSGYADIYRVPYADKPVDIEEFAAFRDTLKPKLNALFGTDIDTYAKEGTTDSHWFFEMYHSDGKPSVSFVEMPVGGEYSGGIGYNDARIDNPLLSTDPLLLNGRAVYMDATASDAEILTSLEWVRDLLFETFGCSFDSARVSRAYQSRDGIVPFGVWVVYYNADDPFGIDALGIRFDNTDAKGGSTLDATHIPLVTVHYIEARVPVAELREVEATGKLISLEIAEELLRNGYVFGGHFCAACMAAQNAVTFDSYDYVGFEYVANSDNDPARAIPFYAFYKRISTDENGLVTYAKTYVCAVEVSGLAAYYEAQAATHR